MTKKLNEYLDKCSEEYSDEELDETFKNSSIEWLKEIRKKKQEKSTKDLKEATGLNNKSTTNWYDKNKFNEILTTIDNNNFNHKNKIGKFKFNDINNLINNIKNNTISESDAKKKINELNEIKKVEIKGKRLIDSQKILLKLFDDLVEAILNNNSSKIVNDDKNKIVNKDNNKIVNEDNNKIVNKDNNINDNDNDNENDNESDDDYDSDNDDENTVKQINNNFKKTDETKSFEDQIDMLKKHHG